MNEVAKYELLKRIINEEDPIGLVDFDAPESLNEYYPELKEILKRDISSFNNKDLGALIHQVFVKFFTQEVVGEVEKYNAIADKFLSQINKI